MADNIAVTPGSGATIATDEVAWGAATVHLPLGKMVVGADGVVETISRGQQTAANSLPMAFASDQVTVGALATGQTNPTTLLVGSFQMVFNATTWDRVTTGQSDGTGSASRIPTTNFTFNGSTFDRQRSASGDTLAVTGIAASGTLVWNGSSFDRARGDITNGLDVDVTRLPALVAGSATIGNVGVVTATAGGCSFSHVTSAGSNNLTAVKTSAAGTIYGIVAVNLNAAVRYLKLFNKATAPTMGTTNADINIAIPGNAAGAGIVIPIPPQGLAFGNGIHYAITAGVALNDNTAVAANEITVTILYA